MALTQLKTGAIADDAVTTDKLANAINTERTANTAKVSLTDNSVTLAKMAGGTDGQIITYDASGDPVAVGPGTDGQVLTSTGAGSPPAFESIPASGISDVVSDTSPQLGGNLDVNTKNIVFGDTGGVSDDRLVFGAGTDLSIYHDGSNSFLANTTGHLISRSDSIKLQDYTNGHDMITATQDGAVELYYDNSKKLETTSAGGTLTGTWNVGKILQVVSITKKGAVTNSTGSASWWSYNNSTLRADITASSASNKFLVIANITCTGNGVGVFVKLMDDGSDVTDALGDAAGSRTRATSGHSEEDSHSATTASMNVLLSAGDTNQHRFHVAFAHTSGSTQTMCLNRGQNDGDGTDRARYISTITVLEIAA